MSLPSIKTPVYDLVIPSTKTKIKYRPYTVKEQSIILMAAEKKETDEIINSMKQLVESCVKSPIDVESLTSFDLQYIFLNLRAKSVGEAIEVNLRCRNTVEEEVCNTINPFTIDIDKVKITFPEASKNEFMITDTLGIKLKYPNLASGKHLMNETPTFDSLIDLIKNDVEYVYDGDKIYDEFTQEELSIFILDLSLGSMEKLVNFYSNIPYMSYDINYVCKKCNHKEKVTLKGIDDFF